MLAKPLILIIIAISSTALAQAITQSLDINAPQPQTATFLKIKDSIAFEYGGTDYQAIITELTETYVALEVKALNLQPKKLNLLINDQKDLDITNDLKPDITFILKEIQNLKASLSITAIQQQQPLSTPEPELTPEEKEAASSSINQFLQIAPYVQQGLLFIGGKLTLFSILKDYTISYGIQAVSEKDPQAGTGLHMLQTLRGFGQALQPTETQPPPTGQAILTSSGKVLAAWDGNNMYYNFKLTPSSSQDISDIFKHATVYAKNIEVRKQFSDSLIAINLLTSASLDINANLFTSMKGNMELTETNAAIHMLDATATDATKLNLESSPHPFTAQLQKGSQLAYNAEKKSLSASKASIHFTEPTYALQTSAASATTENTALSLKTPFTPMYHTKKTKDNNKIMAVLRSSTITPVISIIAPAYTVKGKEMLEVAAKESAMNLEGGKIFAEISLLQETLTISTPAFLIQDSTNSVMLSTLTKETENFRKIYATAPKKVREKFS